MKFFLLLGLVFSMAAAHEIWGEDFDSSGLPLKTCSDKDFPIDYNGKQVGGLKSHGSATDEAACLAACCADDKCQVYQWITKGAAGWPQSMLPSSLRHTRYATHIFRHTYNAQAHARAQLIN